MSTRNLPGDKGRLAPKADNLTTICEHIVYKTLQPLRLTTLWASTASYRDNFTFFFTCYHIEPTGLLACSQDIFTGPYLEAHEPTSQPLILFVENPF
jgi:hypothetical protein